MKPNLFTQYDPPPFGWTRFQSKLQSQKKRQKYWALSLASLMVFVLIFQLNSTKESHFLKQAHASDILFQRSPLHSSEQIKLKFNNETKIAQRIHQSHSSIIYKIQNL